MGLATVAHLVTSFPPIDTVISAIDPLCARMKASAAVAWGVVG